MLVNRGQKFGREPVRAISDPHMGRILTDQITSDGDNQFRNLSDTSVRIEGVAVRMLAGNAGTVYIVQEGNDGLAGSYPLDSTSPAVAIATDDLSKVHIFIPANGDGVAYLAIAQGGEPA